MGLGSGPEIKAEIRSDYPETVHLLSWEEGTPDLFKENPVDVVLDDFDGRWYPMMAGATSLTNIEEMADGGIKEVQRFYGGKVQKYLMLFEGRKTEGHGVPRNKEIVWDERDQGGLSDDVVEKHGDKLALHTWESNEAFARFAYEVLGHEADEEKNSVTQLMSKLMRTRHCKGLIRRYYLARLMNSVWGSSEIPEVQLVGVPYVHIDPYVATDGDFMGDDEGGFKWQPQPKNLKFQEESGSFREGQGCIMSWGASGAKNRKVTHVPHNMPGEGEAKIPRYILKPENRGKVIVVQAIDSDVLVFLLMAMRDLVDPESGEINTQIYLNMGKAKKDEPEAFVLDITLLYKQMLKKLSETWPGMANPVEVYLTNWVMNGCDYLKSPYGMGHQRFAHGFRTFGHEMLARAVICSQGVREDPFITLREKSFFDYMRLLYSCDMAAASRKRGRDADAEAQGKEVKRSKLAEDTERALEVMQIMEKEEVEIKDRFAEMLALVPSQQDLVERSLAKREDFMKRAEAEATKKELAGDELEEFMRKKESRAPKEAWDEKRLRVYIRQLMWVMHYFRHAPHGSFLDPLLRDRESGISVYGWTENPETRKVQSATQVTNKAPY